MKILLLNKYGFSAIGGVETTIKYIARSFQASGHCVSILAYSSIKQMKIEYCPEGTIYKFPLHKTRIETLKQTLNRYKTDLETVLPLATPDIIISRDVELTKAAQIIGQNDKLFYIPPVYMKNYIRRNTGYSFLSKIKNNYSYYLQKRTANLQKKILNSTAHINVFSENMKYQIENDNVHSHIIVNRPGVRTDLHYTSIPKDLLSSHYGLPSNRQYIVFIGRLAPQKNIPIIIEAFKLLNRKNCSLIIVGDGNEKNYLMSLCPNEIENKQIVFIGAQDNVSLYYESALFSIVPSEYEAFGNVIIESMYCGTPVIALSGYTSKIMTATTELIVDGKTGYVVKENTPESFAKVISQAICMSSTDEYYKMRKQCNKFVSENFDWDKFCTNIITQAQKL